MLFFSPQNVARLAYAGRASSFIMAFPEYLVICVQPAFRSLHL
jgi:hypothetical protein